MASDAKNFTGDAFYGQLSEHKLTGSVCESCSALQVPPRPMCPNCYGEEMRLTEMSGIGELAAFTTVHIAPTAMIEAGYDRKNPYCAGIVRLEEGPAISGQILGIDPTNPEEIEVGMAVRMTFIERGEGDQARTFLAFEPVE